jgi:hypothetical protein
MHRKYPINILAAAFLLITLSAINFSCTAGKRAITKEKNARTPEYIPSRDFLKQIQGKTHLIKSIISDTTICNYSGIEETHIRYTNQGDSSMAIHFLTLKD